MRKNFILLMVLGLVNVANAAAYLQIRDSTNTEVTEMVIGQIYKAVISSDPYYYCFGGLYGPTKTADDWALCTPSDPIAYFPLSGTIIWVDPNQGYEWDRGPMFPVDGGDMFSVTLTPIYVGSFQLDMPYYGLISGPEYEWSIQSVYAEIVPEPMTITLMGLGGLFLRRRK